MNLRAADEKGCKRIAYLGGKPCTYINEVRDKGYQNRGKHWKVVIVV
jgi:hypothetical protein